ncbi:hypothetical protein G3I61_28315 [Streptomyces diastaticus]|nr:hypothetical protein [Streptomyces diastaticus]
MTTVEMVDGEEPEVFEPNAYDRLTTLRLVLQGRRVLEGMRPQTRPTTKWEYQEQRDREMHREVHEWMNFKARQQTKNEEG